MYYFILSKHNYNNYGYSDLFFKNVNWKNNINEAKLLWNGNTGFPIIDACVRQLNETGFMHNRCRLLVSNFAIKILHQDPFNWYWGGQLVFSRKLIDCCYANNYGNWNFALGPYDLSGYRFGKKNTKSGRIYKEIIKSDNHINFIRKYIPELKNVPDKDINKWYYVHNKYNINYKPIVNFETRVNEWYKMTKK
jgi:deoxyribodipyrimidine photo-lyase